MNEPIAIVGMAGRFPGAGTIDALWELLIGQGNAIGPIPADRWNADVPLDGVKRVQAVGGFLDGVDGFDTALFGISPREAVDIDPQQRLMLETAWRALEDAGIPAETLRGTRTGVYVGASWHDYETLRRARGIATTQHSLVGTALDVIASRVSYVLGLGGPSLVVETGCSSALVALDLAVRAIRCGDIESALVGGVNLILTPDISIGLTHFGALSEAGRCAAFGAGADGFVRGEGVAAVYLKTLSAARRDGDRVRAVVVNTAVNNDGGGESLVTPSIEGQRELLRLAYADRGIDLGRLAYVEAHGTGTGRGDPIEARALGEMLGAGRDSALGPLLIGSVKTNIGHLEAAAGLAGLIKCVLSLERRCIPASLHADELNPDIAFDELNVQVVRKQVELGSDEPIYVGVNSFGWGGTNAHAVLGSVEYAVAQHDSALSSGPGFLPVSAHSEEALRQRCADIADHLEADPARVDAVAALLARRAPGMSRRVAVLGDEPETLAHNLRRYAADSAMEDPAVVSGRALDLGRVAFVFPGQGAQWHGLGAALYGVDPAFTTAIEDCATALAPHVDWTPLPVISGAAGPEWLERVDCVQPVLWALSVGIAAMWRAMGIEPDAVIGHSQGEIAAATVAGRISVADGALIVARRSTAIRALAGSGRMLAVDLPKEEIPGVLAGFEDSVVLAVDNGPRSCVLAGDTDSIEVLYEILTADDVFCRIVKVDYASHSPQMNQLRPELTEALAAVVSREGSVEMRSTVTGENVGAAELGADYWIENLCRPVLFADAMGALFDSGVTHVIEISPHPVLTPVVEQLAAGRPNPPTVLPSLYRDRDPVAEMRRSRARAYVAGLRPFADIPAPASLPLPLYPMQRQSFWLPPSSSTGVTASTLRVPVHPSVAESGVWHATVPIALDGMGWLSDHRVGDAVVVPGAMMLALSIAACRTRYGQQPAALRNVRFTAALALTEAAVRMDVTLREDITGGASIELRSLSEGEESWTAHARSRAMHAAEPAEPPSPPEPWVEDALNAAEFYALCERRGLNYGPEFQGVQEIRIRPDAALARLTLAPRSRAQVHRGELHTTLLDSAMQVSLALFDDDRTVVPTAINELRLFPEPTDYIETVWVHALRRGPNSTDIHFFDSHSAPLASIIGLELAAIDHSRTDVRRYEREFRSVLRPAAIDALDAESNEGRVAASIAEPDAGNLGATTSGELDVVANMDPGPARGTDRDTVANGKPGPARIGEREVGGGFAARTTGMLDAVGIAELGVAERHARGAGAPGFMLAGSESVCEGLAKALRDHHAAVSVSGSRVGATTLVYAVPVSDLEAQRRALVELSELVRVQVESGELPSRVVVLTVNGCAAEPGDRPDPGAAMFVGFIRVLRREHPELGASIIDVSGVHGIADGAVELIADTGEDQVVFRAGRRYVARLEKGEDVGEYPARPWREHSQPFRLRATVGRRWDGLRYVPLDVRVPGHGEVLVEVECAAVNFIDAMKAAGTYPDDSVGAREFGLECAGVIRALGPGVTGRAVGDRVIACGFGTFASHVTVRADHTALIPAGMTASTAAALPMVITTAWYALAVLGRVGSGDTVLIHSGAGGLGLAAIGVARYLGARVIATAGSAERRAYLRDSHGIEHVFDSRALNWADEVKVATDGRGVDVVLNSLTGVAIDHGLGVLAEDGRFIEVGKKDIYADRRVGLRAFGKAIGFLAVDLTGLMDRRPDRFAATLRQAWRLVVNGGVASLPTTTHALAEVGDVLRNMARGEHIGKLVLDRPESVREIAPEPLPDGRFRADGTYLITGGHGALGRSLAVWLLERGAGAVALLGRNASNWPIPVEEYSGTTGLGADAVVHSYRADVADPEALAGALNSIREELPTLRGVFHAAGVLDDATVLGLSAESVERVLRPKVDGARHLDALTADDPLDLFVLFSSAAALIGNPGQSAYAAANSYLDALAQARRHDGRPGLSIQWGPFSDIGLAAAQENRGARLAAHGMGGVTDTEAWAALGTFLTEDRQVVGYLSFEPRRWFDAYPDCAAQPSWKPLLHSAETTGTGIAVSEFRSALTAATEAERPALVLEKIIEIAAGVLRMTPAGVDTRTPLRSMGLDSLMSLEMRNRLESAFALRLSPTVLWTYGTAEALAGALNGELGTATAEPART